tara:strand:+ start:2909 stop:3070 length:162 start_codon:yes stop_codon:yes gene_type:complete
MLKNEAISTRKLIPVGIISQSRKANEKADVNFFADCFITQISDLIVEGEYEIK